MNPQYIRSAFLSSIFLPALLSSVTAFAQTAAGDQKADQRPVRVLQCSSPTTENVRVFHLQNATQQQDANEIFTALRQILPPDAKSFVVPNQYAIAICAQPDQMALAQRMISELDRPRPNYRLTYVVTDLEGTTRISTHRYSMIVTPGQESSMKQGSRIPIATGSNAQHETQVTYIDVGMSFTASMDVSAQGIRLRTSVEQSTTPAELKAGEATQDPVIRQSTIKGASYLTPGKPLRLGSFDIEDTNRHQELEVTMEPVP